MLLKVSLTKIYINGILIDTNSMTTSGISYAGLNDGFNIGNIELHVPSRFFNRKLDELAVWNEVLSEAEVRKLHDSQNANFTELSSSWTPKYENIVGYWKMDGTWQDSSGNGNHGTALSVLNNTLAKVGSGSGDFDVATSYIEIPHNSNFDISSNGITFSAWIKPHTISGNAEIFNKSYDTGFESMRLRRTGDRWGLRIGDGITWTNLNSSSVAASIDNWSYVVGVFDNVSDELKLYIDGNLDSTIAFTGTPTNNTRNLRLGNYQTTGVYDFDGLIDDAAAWSTALNSEDVLKIYNRQKQKYTGNYDSEVINLGATTSHHDLTIQDSAVYEGDAWSLHEESQKLMSKKNYAKSDWYCHATGISCSGHSDNKVKPERCSVIKKFYGS